MEQQANFTWSTKQSRAKANTVLPRECTGHSKHRLPTTQETLHMDITRWSILKSDWLYSLQQRWRSSIQSAKTRPRADCGSDHELLVSKFRLILKIIWKTTRLVRYDLNQIPYDCTVEVTNRFKGLDLIERVPEELWMEVCDTAGGRDQDHLQEKQMQKSKMVVWGDLRNNQKRREAKDKGENERYTQLNAEFQRKQGEIRKPSSVINAKKSRKTTEWGKTRDLLKKIRDTKELTLE